jgi:hypothetical protein
VPALREDVSGVLAAKVLGLEGNLLLVSNPRSRFLAATSFRVKARD